MENRDIVIQKKADEIRQQLEGWARQNNILEPGEWIQFSLMIRNVPVVVQTTGEHILSKTIKALNLWPPNTRTYLKPCGINTVGDLVKRSEGDLFRINGIGECSVRKIKEKLAELGLKLRSD